MPRSDRFLIAPLTSGLETNVRPWLIPDNAFAVLNNAYVFRGRVRKRVGSRSLKPANSVTNANWQDSRVKLSIGTVATAMPITLPTGITPAIGQMVSVGDQLFTVYQDGAMLSTGIGTGSINFGARQVTIAGTGLPGATVIYYYPATSIMGMITLQNSALNAEQLVVFDQTYAYQFSATGFERLDGEATASGESVWSGSNSQFFWGDNYRGTLASDYLLFVTNYNAADGLRYYDPTTLQWNFFVPALTATATLITARLIISFQGYLIFLNTIEEDGATQRLYTSRCRYSQNGNPLDTNAFRQDIPGRGSFTDAPTKEAIVSAAILRNRLIVYFESKTFELVYTNNNVLPFIWQELNSELGVESTNSIVLFDKAVLGIGNVGIHACNGSNVERIDNKIPNTVFNIKNTQAGPERVVGIRDYYSEVVYWAYPSPTQTSSNPFNNKMLVYNYETNSWAINDDSITMFGYFQEDSQNYLLWGSTTSTWGETVIPWNQTQRISLFRQVIAGNQQGFVFLMDLDVPRNAASLQITNMSAVPNTTRIEITCPNHNLTAASGSSGDFVLIEHAEFDNTVPTINDRIFPVDEVIDSDTFYIDLVNTTYPGTSPYIGGGTLSRVSVVEIITKQYNFYLKDAFNCSVTRLDLLVTRTPSSSITVDYGASSSNQQIVSGGKVTGALLGTSVLSTAPNQLQPLQNTQERLWKPMYPMVQGECVQFVFYWTPEQIINNDIALVDFQLHAMLFYTQPAGTLG